MSTDPTPSSQRLDIAETEFRPSSAQQATERPVQQATERSAVSVTPQTSAFTAGGIVSSNFRLEKLLGRGGMGEAWLAYELFTQRFVVLKFVPKEIQHVEVAMDSVRESFNKIHTLQHQHICPVYGLFTDKEYGIYLVMKHIDGVPLDEYKRKQVAKHGKMPFSDTVHILWGIAKGLDYAHVKMVIHRDIKPQNVLISKKDGVQIIDFGLAEEIRISMVKFSEVEMNVAGTRPYMAPEQWRGRLQDSRTDQYALAVTAYELFTGHPPFYGSDVSVLRECVLHDDPEPILGLSEHANAALLKALSKKREDRFSDCKSFVKALSAKPQSDVDVQQTVGPSLPSDPVTGKTAPPVWVPASSTNSKPATRQSERYPNGWMIALGVAAASAILFGLLGFFFGKSTSMPRTDVISTTKSESRQTEAVERQKK